MKKTKALLNRLIEELEKTPLIQIACDKVGISRNTFYRWMKDDEEFLKRVSEAISIGTGVVNDVAVSNVFEGIKKKDAVYTKYWLDRKHPDFRKPFVFKVDSDDLITHFRSTMEGVRQREIEQNIKNTFTEAEKKKREQAGKEADAFFERWRKVLEKPNEAKARKLFEKWREEYEKNGKKPPEET